MYACGSLLNLSHLRSSHVSLLRQLGGRHRIEEVDEVLPVVRETLVGVPQPRLGGHRVGVLRPTPHEAIAAPAGAVDIALRPADLHGQVVVAADLLRRQRRQTGSGRRRLERHRRGVDPGDGPGDVRVRGAVPHLLVGGHRDDVHDRVAGLPVRRIGHAEVDLDVLGHAHRAGRLAGVVGCFRRQVGLPRVGQPLGVDADLLRLDHVRRGFARRRGLRRAAVLEQHALCATGRFQRQIARAIRPARGHAAQQLEVDRIERRLAAVRHRGGAQLDGEAALLRIGAAEDVAVGSAASTYRRR